MSKEAMKLALEALQGSIAITMAKIDLRNKSIKALEEALAKQEQGEPVAWAHKQGLESISDFDASIYANGEFDDAIPLYTTPQQRTWVGLDEEDDIDWEEGGSLRDLVEAVEAKLKEKNT